MSNGFSTSRRDLLKTAGLAAGLLAAGELVDPTRSGPKPAQAQAVGRNGTFRVLSIDGGGIRGIIPAKVLTYMESLGGPISSMFDLIVGTSTGGIITCGLVVPDGKGRPKLSAQDILDIYTKQALEIFLPYKAAGKTLELGAAGEIQTLPEVQVPHFSLFGSPSPAGTPVSFADAVFQPKYSNQGLLKILADRFGNIPLSQTLKPIMCTSLDLQNQSLYLFKTTQAQNNPAEDFFLPQVAQSTGAAPIYFPASEVTNLGGGMTRFFADGGLAANNPSALAATEAQQMLAGSAPNSDLLLVSIGTGQLDPDPIVQLPLAPQHSFPNWGMVTWAVNGLINVMLNAPMNVTNTIVQNAMPPGQFFRIQPPNSGVTPRSGVSYDCTNDMDDCTSANLAALETAGQWAIETYQDTLAALVQRLTA